MIVVEHDPDVMKVADHVVDMGPGAGERGRRDRVRGSLRRPPARRHADRPLPRPLAADQGARPHAERVAADPERPREQPQGRRRRHPDGRPDGHHRRRRIGQELAHRRRVPARAPGGDRHRPVGGRHVDALEPGDLHRRHGRHPQGVRRRQQGRRRAVQLQLQGRLRELQGLGRDLHRAGVPRARQDAVRDLRGPAVQGRGARVHARRAERERGARR